MMLEMVQRQRPQLSLTSRRDPEVSTFARKAPRYCHALEIAPQARILEVLPLLHVLSKVRAPLSPDLRILDAMAGSGYLTRYLRQAGVENIVAAEACRDMADRIDRRDAKVVNIRDERDLPNIVSVAGSQVVVSLAAFHHLLVDKTTGAVSRERSARRQAKVVRECFAANKELRCVIVADVPTSDDLNVDFQDVPWASFDSMETELAGVARFASQASDLTSYRQNARALTDALPCDNARWFREVVHLNSETGHRDAFLGTEIINMLEGSFSVRAVTMRTPWIFETREQMREFFWDKFSFRENGALTSTDVMNLAAQYLGVRGVGSEIIVGWRLCYIVIEPRNE